MQTTDNFNLKVYEGDDLFNPLTVENDNAETIDAQMYANQTSAIQTATELFTNSIHAITRSVADAPVFRFTAVSNYTAGDTFTVDGIQVSAFLTSGEALPTGAYVIGSEVIGCLKGTRLTIYMSKASAAKADDADKLGGQDASYYGTATAVTQAQETATAAGNLAGQIQVEFNEFKEKSILESTTTHSVIKKNGQIIFNFSGETVSEVRACLLRHLQDVTEIYSSSANVVGTDNKGFLGFLRWNGNNTVTVGLFPTYASTQGSSAAGDTAKVICQLVVTI